MLQTVKSSARIKYFSNPTTTPPLAPAQLVRHHCGPVLLQEVEEGGGRRRFGPAFLTRDCTMALN